MRDQRGVEGCGVVVPSTEASTHSTEQTPLVQYSAVQYSTPPLLRHLGAEINAADIALGCMYSVRRKGGFVSGNHHQAKASKRTLLDEVESRPAPRSEQLDPKPTRVPSVWADHEG